MAPTKGKPSSSKGSNKRSSKPSSGPPGKSSGGIRKKPSGKPSGVKPKIVQQKTKSSTQVKKKKRVYTDKELGIPELNGIKPAGVGKPPNAKKGKNFVGDGEGMHAILAMVMAEKEGNIESKMMRARQLEEVREARKAEMEERANHKKAGFEERKKGIKDQDKDRKKGRSDGDASAGAEKSGTGGKRGSEYKAAGKSSKPFKPKKRVSFG